MNIKILKYGSRIVGETRRADFLRAFERPVETTRIVSFGACNFACPYCKRDGQFRDSHGNIIRAVDVTMPELKNLLAPAMERGERLRLSGGDPVMFPQASLELAKWAMDTYGQKVSIAHNGSSLKFARIMAPYLEYAAIDLKGATGKELAFRAGISPKIGEYMLKSTLQVQDFLSEEGVLVDIRTPIFGDTPLDHIFKMAEAINSSGQVQNKFWTLRAYKKVRGNNWPRPVESTLVEWAQLVSREFPQLPIGIRSRWKGQREFLIFKNGIKV